MKSSILIIILVFLVSLISGCNSDGYSEYDGGYQAGYDDYTEETETSEASKGNDKNYVSIQYYDELVDLADSRFEYLDTTKSSFVNGAWYDKNEKYMVIKLNEAYYHYSEVPFTVWEGLKTADSYGTFYNEYIKGNYTYND